MQCEATRAICNISNLQQMQFATQQLATPAISHTSICNTLNLQHMKFTTRNTFNLKCVIFETHSICNICNLHHIKFGACAISQTCKFATQQNLQHMQLAQHARQISYMDQLYWSANRISAKRISAGRISWTDQFSLLKALASSHIQTLTFQFVHCCSFQVWRKPCLRHEGLVFSNHPKFYSRKRFQNKNCGW